MELRTCERVCKECPFRNTSLPGWLGPHTVEDILQAQQAEALFSCHMQRSDDAAGDRIKLETGQMDVCRGYLISARLSFKMFGQNPVTGKALRELTNKMVITDEERQSVMPRYMFKEYHEQFDPTIDYDESIE